MSRTMALLPPIILQNFNSNLLSIPVSRMGEDSTDIKAIIEFLKFHSKRQLRNLPIKKQKFEKNIQELEKLYDIIKAKEEKLKIEQKETFPRFGNYISVTHRCNQKIFIKFKFWKKFFKFRQQWRNL